MVFTNDKVKIQWLQNNLIYTITLINWTKFRIMGANFIYDKTNDLVTDKSIHKVVIMISKIVE